MNKKQILLISFIPLLYAKEITIPLLGTAKLGSGKLTYQQLVCNKEDPNQTDEYGNTPLHYAVHIASTEVTNLLLAYNADPNIPNKKGKTPLHIAVQVDNDYLVRRLLIYGADPNSTDKDGNTSLHLAAGYSYKLYSYKIVHDLLAHGADQAKKNKQGQTPLMLAQHAQTTHDRTAVQRVPQRRHIESIICMLQTPYKQNHPMSVLDKTYMHTARTTNTDKMRRLIKYPTINVNRQAGKYQRTALMYAVRNNRVDMVELLLKEAHVDSSLTDNNGKTALDYAKKHNNKELQHLLAS